MIGEQFVEYVVLGVVLAVCIAFMVIKGRRKLSGLGAAGCGGGCSCAAAADNPPCAPVDGTNSRNSPG